MKPINEYSFSDFKQLILSTQKKSDNNDWYFSQSVACYYADYRPSYPNRTAADFTVVLDHSRPCARFTLYQDTALLPTISQFSTASELTGALYHME